METFPIIWFLKAQGMATEHGSHKVLPFGSLAISTLGQQPPFPFIFHQRLINIHWLTHISGVVTRYFTKLKKKNNSVHHSA